MIDTSTYRLVPGRVAASVTSTSGTYPYDGVDLGMFKNGRANIVQVWAPVPAEDFGGLIIDNHYATESWTFSCIFRNWNYDMVSKVFPRTATGTTTKHVGLVWDTSQNDLGTLSSSLAVPILFVPFDTDHHECLYLPRAYPIRKDQVAFNLSHKKEMGVAVTWVGIPPVSGGVSGEYRLMEDLSI